MSLLRVLADGERFLAACGGTARLLTCSGDGTTRFEHGAEILCMDVMADGRSLATGGGDRTVRVWDLAGGACTLERSDWNSGGTLASYKRVFEVRFSPSGKLLASSCDDGFLRFYELPAGRVIAALEGPRFGKILWLSEERVALMPKWSGGLVVLDAPFDVQRWRELEPWPNGRCMALDASPDKKLMLTSSTDGRTLLWSLEDFQPWASVAGNGEAVTWAGFAPDGLRFATASADGSLRLWPVDPESAARALQPAWMAPSMPASR